MAEITALAEVWMWGLRVGAVAEAEDGQVTFEYDPEFRRQGLEISPLMLPLSRQGPITFPELHRVEAFQGLPGVLADALPDRFGNAVIQKYFSDRGRAEDAMRPVQKLLYIGRRAMGALEFRPPLRMRRPAGRESLEIAELVEQARVVIEGRPDVSIPEMMRVGASAGGARAKALILWNRDTDRVRSGFATPRPGDEHWIVKFDGVGELGKPDNTPKPFNRIEFVYSRMARDAGITLPEIRLLEERRLGHLLVRRFDRPGKQRLHLHSLGGLHHVDFNAPGLFSYEQFLRTILALGLDYPTMEEAYRRSVFNIVAVNQDDHVKNISFLMDSRGTWRLSPAYDLTYARGTGYTRHHQMSLNGKRDDFTRDDLLALGRKMGIKRNGKDVIDEVIEAMSRWEEYAREAKVPGDKIESIRKQFRLFPARA
jgi:serine/threonine-protein kinase HipA